MNKKIIALIGVILVLIISICAFILFQNSNETNKIENNALINNNTDNTNISNIDTNRSSSNILIAFFSRAGENYNVGTVEKGNTQIMAENIAEITSGTIFQIEPVESYPINYNETTQIAQEEQRNNARPEIKAKIDQFDDYDTIFIGYPIWYGDMPQIIYTFLEQYDFTGKTIIPFNTHAGSGNSGTYNKIKSKLTNSKVLDGLAITGSEARKESSKNTIKNWIDKLGIVSKGENTGMVVNINNIDYNVILDNNVTVNEILSNLPLDLNMVRYANHEYYSELPFTPTKAENTTSEIKAGHIYYWDGWNAFVINYENADITPYKVVHIGEIEDKNINTILKNVDDNIKIKVNTRR